MTQQIDNYTNQKPEPTWDQLIRPEVVKVQDAKDEAARVEREQERLAAEAEAAAREAEAARIARLPKPFGTFANGYAFGNCTWYVASRKQVPDDWGNANTWFWNAQAAGWRVGYAPEVGAIAQTTVGWAGHVALVEAVDGGNVLVSEMNYDSFDQIDQRWAGANEFEYIY